MTHPLADEARALDGLGLFGRASMLVPEMADELDGLTEALSEFVTLWDHITGEDGADDAIDLLADYSVRARTALAAGRPTDRSEP